MGTPHHASGGLEPQQILGKPSDRSASGFTCPGCPLIDKISFGRLSGHRGPSLSRPLGLKAANKQAFMERERRDPNPRPPA
jgi:hypothetical protein